ncbi:MAG TPA: hypothetical protein VGT40_26460 [Methylomirabilota bacterium]|jgi:hypothetical protein|nr:hypothetical protein [Methylomirabilota bacterium]
MRPLLGLLAILMAINVVVPARTADPMAHRRFPVGWREDLDRKAGGDQHLAGGVDHLGADPGASEGDDSLPRAHR